MSEDESRKILIYPKEIDKLLAQKDAQIAKLREALERTRIRLTALGDNNCSFIQEALEQTND